MQDGEQKIWRQFLPVGIYREINAGSFSKQNQKIWNDFKKNVESEYGGIDGVYTFDKLREMTIEDNKNIYIPSEDGIDYDSSL